MGGAGREPPPRTALQSLLHGEAAGGIALLIAAAAGLIVANGPLAPAYFAALDHRIGPFAVHRWIDDALMPLFFLLVGLEIKRELVGGRLARPSDRILPVAAALGGMAAPALVYLAVTAGTPGLARGWAIPAATDIAFALGVLALIGRRAPPSLRLFLTSVAIVDDMGAVAIIALAYTAAISGPALLAAMLLLAAMFGLNRSGVRRLWPYLALAAALWGAVLASGIHPTIAGVLAALAVPGSGTADARGSPLHRLEDALRLPVAFLILPVFAFANAGVALGGLTSSVIAAPLPLGLVAALFVGKQAGVLAAVQLVTALGLARRPAGATWRQMHGVALLCGIGFTMSLFIGGLAFDDPALMGEVRVGVLAGSILSALAGTALLLSADRPRRRSAPAGDGTGE